MTPTALFPFFRRRGRLTRQERLVRELILFAGLLAAGFVVLPTLAWLLGSALLGAQSEGIGLGSVYGSVFGEAARGKAAAWLFAASPWLFVQSVRLALWPYRPAQPAGGPTDRRAPDDRPAVDTDPIRLEPPLRDAGHKSRYSPANRLAVM